MQVVSFLFPHRRVCIRFELSLEKTVFGMTSTQPEPFLLLFFPGCLAAPTGLEDYMKRYGEGIRRVLASFGPVPEFSGEGAESIFKVSLILKLSE